MALGFTTSNAFGSLAVLPDRGFTREATQSVQTISFGDGYEQRIAVGINSTKETYNLTFANRTKQDIDNIAGFLNSTNGVTAFAFTVPDNASTEETTGILDNSADNEKTIKVVCDKISQTYAYDNHYSLTATFRRVFEP